MKVAGGIGEKNRAILDTLHRKATGPFTVSEAAAFLDMKQEKARRLLAHFAEQGWLSRIRRNTYTPVPLGASSPGEWREDPWIVAAKTFAPCYLGGWTACEHWSLTEQIFRDVIVITNRLVRHREQEIQGTRFRMIVRRSGVFFGLQTVWRGQTQVQVSDPTRTMIDLLDSPTLGGGVRHVREILAAYFGSSHRDDSLLLQYATRLGNRAVFKRMGFLMERMNIESPTLLNDCLARISAGISLLDPSAGRTGAILKRWGLRVNVSFEDDAQ
jgi:predicted transcriptional regulator of viral defense system